MPRRRDKEKESEEEELHPHRWKSPQAITKKGAPLPSKYRYKPPATASAPIPQIVDPLAAFQKAKERERLYTPSEYRRAVSQMAHWSKGKHQKEEQRSLSPTAAKPKPKTIKITPSELKKLEPPPSAFDMSLPIKAANRMRYGLDLDFPEEAHPRTFNPKSALKTIQDHEATTAGDAFEVVEADDYRNATTASMLATGKLNDTLGSGDNMRTENTLDPVAGGTPATNNFTLNLSKLRRNRPHLFQSDTCATMDTDISVASTALPNSSAYPAGSNRSNHSPVVTRKTTAVRTRSSSEAPGSAAETMKRQMDWESLPRGAGGHTTVKLPQPKRLPSANNFPRQWDVVAEKEPTTGSHAQNSPTVLRNPGNTSLFSIYSSGTNEMFAAAAQQQEGGTGVASTTASGWSVGSTTVGGVGGGGGGTGYVLPGALGSPSCASAESVSSSLVASPVNITVAGVPAPALADGTKRRSVVFQPKTGDGCKTDQSLPPLASVLDPALVQATDSGFSYPTLTAVGTLRPRTHQQHLLLRTPDHVRPSTSMSQVVAESHRHQTVLHSEDTSDNAGGHMVASRRKLMVQGIQRRSHSSLR